jgi:uridine phosphorylase
MSESRPPILADKNYEEESVFSPENLLREARRQKKLGTCSVPKICILDPDGDIVQYLLKSGKTKINNCWACYHTTLYSFWNKDKEIGIIGNVVGASFAVLVSEQLLVSGCELIISITSAGILRKSSDNPQFMLITEAIRDEGTSYHYLPSNIKMVLNQSTENKLQTLYLKEDISVKPGKSWTTDAPYRETQSAIKLMIAEGADIVEMESSALYALAINKNANIICFAHLTNTMAQTEGDFEKGSENGSIDSLKLIQKTIDLIKL